jgi:hypothetical protein
MVTPMRNGATSLATDSAKPSMPPFGGVVHRVPGEGDLPAVGGHLDDPPAALGAQARQAGPDELNGAGQVGGDDVADLLVGQFLGRAEQAVPCVADDNVDAAERGEPAVGDVADGGGVGDVEQFAAERVRVRAREVGDAVGSADGAHYNVAAAEDLGGQLAAEAAADAGDEPVLTGHGQGPSAGAAGAISLMAARALRVRG